MEYSTAQLKEIAARIKVSVEAEAEAVRAIEKVICIRETGTLPENGNGTTKDGRPNRLTPAGVQAVREARQRRAEREREAKFQQGLREVGKSFVVRPRDAAGKYISPTKKSPKPVTHRKAA